MTPSSAPLKKTTKMPKATQKSTVVDEEGDDPHSFINPLEAKAHTNSLDQVMTLIEEQVKESDMADLLERAMGDMKATLANTIPTMQLAEISMMTRAIQDKCFNVLLCYLVKIIPPYYTGFTFIFHVYNPLIYHL